MNWDDLRIFLAVARTGTLSAAGRRLALDATTVARRLGRLEAEVGRSLFEVTTAGHILTARGQELLTHVQAMESAAIACAEGAQAGSVGGTIRVSVAEGFGTNVIAPHLGEFADAHPGIGVELVTSSGFLNLSRREADLAVMLARPRQGPLVARKLTDYHLGLYAQAGTVPPATLEELTAERLVGYVPDLIYAPELHYLEEVAPGLTPALSSTSVNAQAAMIRSGAGIGILHCFVGDADQGFQRVFPDRIDIRRAYWLVMHRDLRGVARVKAFVDWLDRLIVRMRPLLVGRP
ncbi:LysR family transcriptional regulator [Sphingomonas sp. ID1715]|nr:LysR family transcriptional regulator [Sphingomonas sp. ID1715]